jgi:hypothetical protein
VTIDIKCEFCGALIATIPTLGNQAPTQTIDDAEKRCVDCDLTKALGEWPAVLQQTISEYRAQAIPEQRLALEANIRTRFRRRALLAARAHFGALFDEACAQSSVDEDVIALVRDTPITIDITLGGGGS